MEWVLIAIGIFFAAGNKAVSEIKEKFTNADFIKKLSVAAQDIANQSHIPLKIIVTQAAHESRYGQSGLAMKANNLFGIKAGSSWVGPTITMKTWENIGGKDIQVDAAFRAYSTYEASVRDWLKFIQGSRYSVAYAAAVSGDAPKFFAELQKAGYATDPNYATQLVRVLENITALV